MGIFKRVSILATHVLSRIYSTFKEKMPKVKAYQNTTPFDDPEKERKRQNAIKAKEARDLKKAEHLSLKKENNKWKRIAMILSNILKSHNIKNPVEDFDDEDMEII